MKFSKGGFTLAEFIIVIAIVVALSLIAFPIYKKYAKQAYLSEGESLLMVIKNAQKKYLAEHGIYYDGKDAKVSEDKDLGVNASENKNFNVFSVTAQNSAESKSYTSTVYGKNSNNIIKLTVSESGRERKTFK